MESRSVSFPALQVAFILHFLIDGEHLAADLRNSKMTLSDLTSADAVRRAAAEIRRLGGARLSGPLRFHGISEVRGSSRRYCLRFEAPIVFYIRYSVSATWATVDLNIQWWGTVPTSSVKAGLRPGSKERPAWRSNSRCKGLARHADTTRDQLGFEFRRTAVDALIATKVERSLIDEFTEFQRAKGRTFTRWDIFPRGSTERLLTDIYDEETHTLYEAKASSTRSDLRLGLGQILDYSRFIDECEALALLLLSRPADDLIDLLHAFEVRAVWRKKTGIFKSSHGSIYLG